MGSRRLFNSLLFSPLGVYTPTAMALSPPQHQGAFHLFPSLPFLPSSFSFPITPFSISIPLMPGCLKPAATYLDEEKLTNAVEYCSEQPEFVNIRISFYGNE